MQLNTVQKCEQCRREVDATEIVKLECDQHIGYICRMCDYILTKQKDQVRFKSMIREKTYEQSNIEMQEIHRLLSVLITVGLVFCLVIASALAVKVFDAIPTLDVLVSNLVHKLGEYNVISPFKKN